MKTFTSFQDLAKHMNAEDVRKAQNLKRSASLRKTRVQGSGPAVAR